MTSRLETLDLGAEQLSQCQDAVRQLAYTKWSKQDARPGMNLDFWLEAEREWISHCYVPNRPCDGARPEDADYRLPSGPKKRSKARLGKVMH